MAIITGKTIHECDICKKQSVALPISVDHKGIINVNFVSGDHTFTEVCNYCMRSFREWLDQRRAMADAQPVKWQPPELHPQVRSMAENELRRRQEDDDVAKD